MSAKTLASAQLELLKKPLPTDAVKPHPTKNYLSSIKAIYVVERFNEVFGLGGWFVNNEVVKVEGKMVVVKSTFQAPEYGITIPDIFGGNDNSDLGDAYKGACTDALTKIGSYLYVGMDVFKGLKDAPAKQKPKLNEASLKALLERIKKGEKGLIEKAQETYQITEEQLQKLKAA